MRPNPTGSLDSGNPTDGGGRSAFGEVGGHEPLVVHAGGTREGEPDDPWSHHGGIEQATGFGAIRVAVGLGGLVARFSAHKSPVS